MKIGNNEIGKVFLGNVEIERAYYGNNLVFGTSPMIPYIRNTDVTAYIDTGIKCDSTSRVIVWARNFCPNGEFLFGARDATPTTRFSVLFPASNMIDRIRIDFGSNNQTYVDNAAPTLCGYHKYELNGNKFYIDDVLKATCPTATFTGTYNLHLFGNNNAGSHSNVTFPIDICACKIYKDGVLVRDYTATNTPSVGLYDAVSQTLFTSAGSGNFTYGTFNPNAYTPLQYIELTNAQYFDTLVYGNRDLPVVIKFKTIGTDLGYPDLFGTMNKGTNGTYFLFELSSATYKNRYANLYINTSTANQLYNNNSTKMTNKVVTLFKTSTTAALYENNALIGTQKTFSTETFTTPYTMAFGSLKNNGVVGMGNAFNGYIYYGRFGDLRNYVPALVNSVAGMYDTYNEKFYPSESGTDFIAGPFVYPKYKTVDDMILIRHWSGNSNPIDNRWYDLIGNQYYSLTNALHENGYYEFVNSSAESSTSYGLLDGTLPDLCYHWKIEVEFEVKTSSDTTAVVVDFGSVTNTGNNTCAIGLYNRATRHWHINSKLDGNESGPTYTATDLLDNELIEGEWVRRKVTFGVRASEEQNMDECFITVDGIGTTVTPVKFAQIRMNKWATTPYYIARSSIEPSSTYKNASNIRLYNLKIYYEPID